jgi:hypothetical protein
MTSQAEVQIALLTLISIIFRIIPVIKRTIISESPCIMGVVTAVSAMRFSSHAVRVKTVFPLSHFSDLLFTVFVIFVVVRAARIINIIPVLNNILRTTILLAFLPATPWPLFPTKDVIDIFVIGGSCGPVRDCGFSRRKLWSRWLIRDEGVTCSWRRRDC